MSKRWTQADIDKLKGRGIVVSNSAVNRNEGSEMIVSSTHLQRMQALGRLKPGAMNKTEEAYAKYLETMKQIGEVVWYEFEPMKLRIAEKCFYTVDFLVMLKSGQLECHEVKGFIVEDSLVKIKAAAAKYPFRFIMVKLEKGEWKIREF